MLFVSQSLVSRSLLVLVRIDWGEDWLTDLICSFWSAGLLVANGQRATLTLL